MRRSKEIWYLLLFSLLIAAVTGWIMTAGRKEEKNSYTVSVIVNNSSDSRWTSLREGAEAAARDYNIRLNYVATGEFWGKQNELEIISKELESGVDGMIIQMYASEGVYEGIEAKLPREKCVLLETDITPEEYYQTVGPDNKELGSALAERICQDFRRKSDGKDNRYSLWKHWSDRSETTTGWVGGDASESGSKDSVEAGRDGSESRQETI